MMKFIKFIVTLILIGLSKEEVIKNNKIKVSQFGVYTGRIQQNERKHKKFIKTKIESDDQLKTRLELGRFGNLRWDGSRKQ